MGRIMDKDTLSLKLKKLKDKYDNVIDISGATIYTTMKEFRTGTVVTSRQTAGVTIDSSAGGLAHYSWQASDTVTAGHYKLEFEIHSVSTFGGKKFSYPVNPNEPAEIFISAGEDEV